MKKSFILGLSCLTLLCGCNKSEEIKTEEIEKYTVNPLIGYIGVLDSNTTFKNVYNKKDVKVNNITSFKDSILDNPLEINSFAPISMFNDANNQSIILKSDDLGYIVLGTVDGNINGYFFYTREMINLKKDGSFMTSSSASEEAICKLNEFYVTEILANTKDGKYYINRSEVSKEAYDKYVNDFNKKEDLSFKEFNTSNINKLKKG